MPDALWLQAPGGPYTVGDAPETRPAAGEIAVRVRAVAMNPIDALPGLGRRVVLPWLRYPAVIGSDVAGEVIDVGPGVTRLEVGDRVLGHAVGVERSRNRSAEGAFQERCILLAHMTSPIPDGMSLPQAAVLPLALSTAATGLFQDNHLALRLPGTDGRGPERSSSTAPSLLVWGGSSSVGGNAIQLARCCGYRVIATASAQNADHVRELGADDVVDYRSPDAVPELRRMLQGRPFAGAIAIGSGSLAPTLRAVTAVGGDAPRRVASAQPGPGTSLRRILARTRGIQVSIIWGSSLKDNRVGPSVYADFLPGTLADGRYRAAPEPLVAGHGLQTIPDALDRLRHGVSARKIVVSL